MTFDPIPENNSRFEALSMVDNIENRIRALASHPMQDTTRQYLGDVTFVLGRLRNLIDKEM